MAFVDIRPTVHLTRLAAGETPFSVAVPAQHPGRLMGVEIDEGFEIGKAQLPSRQAFCRVQLRDNRDEYETRRLQAGDVLIVQDADDGGAATVRFRGRIRKPRVRDDRHGRILISLEAHGLWTRIRQAADVSVPAILDTNGKQAVDSVLDQVPWPTSFRDVTTPPEGTNINYAEWAYDGPPVGGIGNALAGINPRSKFFVDAAGVATVVWLSEDIQQYRANEIRPLVSFDDTELHVINQVVATALDITRTTTTRHTSSAVFNLDDDADTVIFEGTLDGDDENARWAFEFRQPNGTYFPHHDDVNGSLTAVLIQGTTVFRVVATARARSGIYTTVVNFFQIRSTIVSLTELTEAPLVRNLNNVAPDEPKQFIVPSLPYPAGHAETLADNYLSLWGNPLQFATFEVVANDDGKLPKLRGAHLWRRVSLFDGDTTHFGFVARRQWTYGKETIVRLTMVEDFTEGGDISIPFRLPFEWVFNNLAALTMLFDRASELNNQGAWAADSGGSTPTNNTGPTSNNVLPFVHTETTNGDQADHDDNGVLAAKEDTFDVIRNRDIVFRYAAYGDFGVGDGLVVQGRTVQTSIVNDLLAVDSDINGMYLRRLNPTDITDMTDPYGALGNIEEPFTNPAVAVAVASNGDYLVLHNLGQLYRYNPADLADRTGDYGLADAINPGGGSPSSGLAVDANGNGVAARGGTGQITQIKRLILANPTFVGGGFGVDYTVTGIDNSQAVTVLTDGRWLIGDDSTDKFYVISPADINATTNTVVAAEFGDYPTGVTRIHAMAVASDTDLYIVQRAGSVYRLILVNLADTTDTSGGYGTIGDLAFNTQGLELLPRTVSNFGAWTDIATLPASTYPSGNLSDGDTDTDVEGNDYTVVADGGWRDIMVSIPNTYQEIRLRPNLNAGGTANQQDIALRSIRSA